MPKTRLVEFMAVGCLALALGIPAAGFAAPPSSLKAPLLVQNETNESAQQSQQKINNLAEQTNTALQEYLTTMQQIDRLKAYNAQLSRLIQSQKESVASIKQQMGRLDETRKQIMPLMLRMVDRLRQFVKLDVPFQLQDRLARVSELDEIMDDANITIAEKFRQIMAAYMQEINYGRKIQAYRGALNTNGTSRTVDFLRIGRIALLYQTIDGSETGFYNRLTQQWEVRNDLADEVSVGLLLARQSTKPQLLVAPVPAPQPAETQ